MKIFRTLALIAGVFLVLISACGAEAQASTSPWNTSVEMTVDGVVFRYTLSTHLSKLSEEEKEKRCVYRADKDKVADELRALGLPEKAVILWLFPEIDGVLTKIEKAVTKEKSDATFSFDADKNRPFDYVEGQNGVSVDYARLLKKMTTSKKFNVPLKTTKAATVADLKTLTAKRGENQTFFDQTNENRAHNVALALSKLNGAVIGVGETFSFNAAVGKRTKENGFLTAKIIVDGIYVEGDGGGVCQASTTLYGALLLSGVRVVEAHAHSLVPSYVAPSLDAMVNYATSDLRFVNDTGYPLYLQASASCGRAFVAVYGLKSDAAFSVESVVVSREKFSTTTKPSETVAPDTTKVLFGGSDGVKSEAWLIKKQNGKEERFLLRKDVYKKSDRVILVPPTVGKDENAPSALSYIKKLFCNCCISFADSV